MQDESTVLPSGGEIYKNLRWPEGHELPSFINGRFRAHQEPTSMRSSCDFRQCRRTRTYLMNRFGKGTASQAAEKFDIALDFGWRSGSPLR
jgi:hypothetical protein